MFDLIVLTASNASQARGYRRELERRRASGALCAGTKFLVVPDPGGVRAGSLGATVNVLSKIGGVEGRRVLICHSGGDSRRTVGFSATGKSFIPLPSYSRGGDGLALFDLIVDMADSLPPRSGGEALVVSGDVLLTFDPSEVDFSRPGVSGVAYCDSLEQGSRHGVYVPGAPLGSGRACAVKGFLQKPGAAEAEQAGAVKSGKVAVDTGIMSIDAATCEKMVRRGWKTGDLYEDFTAELLGGFAPFSVNVVGECEFLHLGSNAELLDALTRHSRTTELRGFEIESRFLRDVAVEGRLKIRGHAVMERCFIGGGTVVDLAGDNIVTGIPESFRGILSLKKGECVAFLPVGEDGWRRIDYRVEDNFKEDGKWESLGMASLLKSVDHERIGEQLESIAVARRMHAEVVVSAPVRIDLAGGWSDTPPICFEMGGTVLNAAVTLDGCRPIEVRVKPISEHEVHVRSVDLGLRCTIRSMDEIRDHSDPRDWCALVKSALAVTDYDIAKGGLAVSICADLPKGSGMGTSSILGAATIAALDRVAGRPFDEQRVSSLTLALEREMSTGGGWQDQLGGLVPGVKILRSSKGADQRPEAEHVGRDAQKWLGRLFAERGLLYFTGQKRMARNILRKVLSFYAANPHGIAEIIVNALKENAERGFEAVKAMDAEGFAEAVNSYWTDKKLLDPGSTNERVEEILEQVKDRISAAALAGAGGGGFMFLLARSAGDALAIRRELESRAPTETARFYDFSIDVRGLEVRERYEV